MAKDRQNAEKRLADLPMDELRGYAAELGLDAAARTLHADLLRFVRQRRELLLELDREALLDVVVWARRPVRKSVGKEHLAKLIAGVDQMRFDGLSHRGLVALARLRGVEATDDDADDVIISRMRKREGFWTGVKRKRRRLVGWAMERIIEGDVGDQTEYQFLPEDPSIREPRLRDEVESRGVVAGIAGRLRNAADDYVAEKLDEIEIRIDQKLDEIDARLAEWRDREVANRLRIIKITLAASLVVALLSLGYKYAHSRMSGGAPTSQPAQAQTSVVEPDPGAAGRATHRCRPVSRRISRSRLRTLRGTRLKSG